MGGAGLLPAVGFGTAPLGGFRVPVTEDDAAAAVEAALEVGYRYFDTAPLYGYGLAERRLGSALAGRDAGVQVSTKVGRLIDEDAPRPPDDLFAGDRGAATFDFSADGVRRSLEASFERMGRTYVDAAFIHDPDDHARQALTEAYPALERLRAEGAVGAIGVGMNRPGLPTRFVTETDIDMVLIAGPTRCWIVRRRRNCSMPRRPEVCTWWSEASTTRASSPESPGVRCSTTNPRRRRFGSGPGGSGGSARSSTCRCRLRRRSSSPAMRPSARS